MKRLFVLAMLVLLGGYQVMAQIPKEFEVSEIMDRAVLMYKQEKYQEALSGFLRIADCSKKKSDETERQIFVFSQTMAVMCYEHLKQYEEAYLLSEELLEGDIDLQEKKQLQHLCVINGYFYAMSCAKTQKSITARAVLDKILPMADSEMREKIQEMLPMTWFFEGSLAQMEQNYHHALVCLEKAQVGFHEVGDTENELDSWSQIGSVKQKLYDIMGALEAYKQAESLAVLDGDEIKHMAFLKEQLKLYEQLDDSESVAGIRTKMSLVVENFENDEVAFQYNMFLAEEAKDLGQTKLAEMYYLKNESYIKNLGDDYRGADRYIYYIKLRDLYLSAERPDDALKYHRLIKEETQGGRNKEDTFFYYAFLSNIYKRKGDSVNCFHALDTLFNSQDLYSEPREAAQFYVVRGGCHAAFQDYESALADYRRADELLAEKYDEDDGDRIEIQLLMGGMEYRLNHFEESELRCQNYLEGTKKLVGESHTDYIDGLGYLAKAEALAGHIEAACGDYTLAVEKLKRHIQNKLPYLTPSKREGYWKSVSELLQGMTSFALKAEQYQTAFTQSCYDALVLSKAFLLASDRSAFDLIKDKGTVDDLNDYAVIAAMQERVREWEKEGDKYVDSILFLTSKIELKETYLASRCRAYGDITTFMDWDYQTIKSKLSANDVLIDFTDFLSISDDQGRIYAAYMINNEQEYPLLKRLFDESSIDSALIAHPDLFYDTLFSAEVYRFLWEPFEKEVNEGATVYYVPSQLLFQVALESLLLPDGTLLGEHYRFIRLSSARELASFNEKLNLEAAGRRTDAVLYGGLQYDVEASIMAAEAKRYDLSQILASRGGSIRGDSIFCELPWSKTEIDTIEKKLKERGFSVCPYTGAKGTEESFLNLNGKAPQVLHIATHGFYYTPDKAKEVKYLRGYEDAMSLTGLVMSGSNTAWLGQELPEGVLDGILTANDIAQLDLSCVDLVVLSACQSGNGKATSEGLYGLQRAFKKSGVKTVVMSLWDLSDKVGTEFMIAFYESVLDESKGDVREALNTAKSKIRKKYPQPYYWAGLVVLD